MLIMFSVQLSESHGFLLQSYMCGASILLHHFDIQGLLCQKLLSLVSFEEAETFNSSLIF